MQKVRGSELIEIAKKEGCKGVVFDNDKTICKVSSAEYVGHKILGRELKRGNFQNVLEGLYGIMKIRMDIIRNGGEEDASALKTFCQTLGNTGCADRISLHYYAMENVKKNCFDGVDNFVNNAKKELGPAFLATNGLNFSADATMYRCGMTGRVSNPPIYKVGNKRVKESPYAYVGQTSVILPQDSLLVDCEVVMRRGPDKKKCLKNLLEPLNLDISEMLAIGDKYNIDKDFMDASLLSAASPKAERKTRNNSHYQIASFD